MLYSCKGMNFKRKKSCKMMTKSQGPAKNVSYTIENEYSHFPFSFLRLIGHSTKFLRS